MSNPATNILAFLGTYRNRRLRQELWAGGLGLLSLVLALALLGFVGWLLAERLGWLRTLIWAGFAIGLLWLGLRHVIGPRLRLRPQGVALAREVERRLGEAQLDLVSAIQLKEAAGRPDRAGGVSPELVQAHLERVARGLAGRDPAGLVAPGRLRRPTLALAALGLATAGVWLSRPEAWAASLTALVSAPPKDEPATAEALQSWVGDIRLEYRYPAYTGRQDRRAEATDGAILALPGTQVSLVARADRPIAAGSLRLGEDGLPLRVRDGRTLAAELVVMEPGAYRFELQDAGGERWRSPRGHPIQIEADRPPRVHLSQPERDLVVREKQAIDILYDARDDFGLSEVRLVWRSPGGDGGAQRRVLQRLAGQGQRATRQRYRWELAGLDLAPGDQIQFYIEATDNDTVRGPKVGRSATVSLKIFSADEHHRELMERVQALWEQMLSALADHLAQEPRAKAPGAGADDGDRLEGHERLHQGLTDLVERQAELGAALRQDRLAWQPLIDALDNIRQGLARHAEQVGWLLHAARARGGRLRGADQRALAAFRSRGVGRLELDVLYLEDLLDLERLEDLDQIARDLDRARGRLSELMERYKRAPDDETRREIETQIARLKQKVARLLERQREVLKAVRDEYLNPEALSKLTAERDVMSALDRIQALMMEGKMDQAMAELDRLGKQIDALQQAIDRSRQDFGQQRYRELAAAMARMQGELNQIVEQQRQVAEQTGGLRRKMDERLARRGKAAIEAEMERLRKRLAGLMARLEGIDARRLDPFATRDRERALEQARLLDKLLEAGDLARALETAEGLLAAAEGLRNAIGAQAEFTGDSRLAAWRKDAAAASAEARAIEEALRRLLPSGRQLLHGAEPEQVRGLRRRQQELGARLAQLRGQMQELNQKVPLFGQQMFGGLERSGRSMRQAGSDLGQFDPRSAHPHQQDALAELQRMQQQMKQSCKRSGSAGGMPLPLGHGGSGGRGPDMGGPGDPSLEPVEIPGAEAYKPPEAFRKELLDGMKDPVPDDYQPQVRRYYEELVK